MLSALCNSLAIYSEQFIFVTSVSQESFSNTKSFVCDRIKIVFFRFFFFCLRVSVSTGLCMSCIHKCVNLSVDKCLSPFAHQSFHKTNLYSTTSRILLGIYLSEPGSSGSLVSLYSPPPLFTYISSLLLHQSHVIRTEIDIYHPPTAVFEVIC